MQPRLVWALEAQLGEGPIWLPDAGGLWFVDIKRGTLHRFDPARGEHDTLEVGGNPSFIVAADDGSLLVGNRAAIHPLHGRVLGPAIARVVQPASNRTNDATVDAAGRLWFGTMDDNEAEASGAVHLFAAGEVTAVGGESVITNGPAVSPDGRHLYHVDTVAGAIWRFDIGETDRLVDGTPFVRIAPEHGNPDGVTVDAAGCLWVALWGGWGVRRYAPGGALLAEVRLPCAQVTKIAFGGADLRTAFVTTARVGLSAEALAGQPDAGGLFAFEVATPGLPAVPVKLAR